MDIRTKIFPSEDRESQENTAAGQGFSGEYRKALTLQIMENCRNELYSRYPYLDGAFAALPLQVEERVEEPGSDPHSAIKAETVGTDGEKLYVSPAFLLPAYGEDPARVRHGYLHILLHCLYLHLWMGPKVEKMGDPDSKKWDLACDLTVEWMLRDIEKAEKTKYSPKVENEIPTDSSFSTESGRESIRNHCFALLDEQSRKLNMRGISAEQTYGWIKMGIFPYEDAVLEQCFAFDSHAFWRKMGKSGGAGAKKKWEDLLLGINGNSGGRGARGSSAGNEREEMDALKKGRYDYRRFLKRFAVMREEIELDMESFDYIPYDLGMRMFGNLPFVEPLEYKEVHKLEELVIAIDTSSSCSKETVQAFLNETYSILNEKENFFRRFKVVLIQCDCFLQSAVILHNEEEWMDYIQHVVIEGRSGTDFRPVFRYVEELRQKRELRNLKALIYFTDGDGIYPTKAADYETAFVFLEKNDYMDMVPGWALKLIADQREMRNRNEYKRG